MARRAKKTKRVTKANSRQVAFTRFMLIVAVLIVWMGGISARLVHLQVTQHEWLKDKASGQRSDVKSSKLPRGTIYDRNERALAISVRVKTLYADATQIDDTKSAAKSIAKATGIKESVLAKQLSDGKTDGRKFVPLAKGLDEETVQKINKTLDTPGVNKPDSPNFAGLHWRDEQKRSYPYQNLAAHVIGFSNAEGIGQAGIEQSQNEILYGAVIKKRQERDRLGRVYDETVSEKEPPKDIVLTISAPVQFMVEQALDKAVKASQARAGMAIVIDNRSGEILALANNPTFDPNDLRGITEENLANNAIHGVYSPGSVFKLITYGSALERDLIAPEAEIDSGNGTIVVAKHRFSDSHAIGKVSYTKAMAHSSNVCAIKTGLRVGKEGFYETMLDFGFGKRTGIELPAETNGIVRNVERWNGDSLASMSIGYEVGVTALQMASAFAAVANDGVRIQPHIIKEIRDQNDDVISTAAPEKKQVVSTKTARDLRTMLRQVVVAGTGKRAQLEGYTSAGKTGTAWKFDEKLKKVNSAKYVSSFIGFAPAESPAVTIAVVMDEPKVGGRDGGQAAGPVFREIAQQILPELNIHPEGYVPPNAVVEDIPEISADGPGEIVSIEGAESLKAEPEKAPLPAINTEKPTAVKKEPSEPVKDKPKATVPIRVGSPKPVEVKPEKAKNNKPSPAVDKKRGSPGPDKKAAPKPQQKPQKPVKAETKKKGKT